MLPEKKVVQLASFMGTAQNSHGDPVHDIAAKYYALAHRAGYVKGPPKALAVVDVEPQQFFLGLVTNSVRVYPDQCTIAFACPASDIAHIHKLCGDEERIILEVGYSLL